MTKKAITKRIIELNAKSSAYEYASQFVAADYKHNGTDVREYFEKLARICRNEARYWEEVLAE